MTRIIPYLAALLIAATASAQPAPAPLGVEPTPAMIKLGAELFKERALSADGTVSCASCHDERKGWADGLPVAVGIRGGVGTLNTPSILNAAHSTAQFWNGRTIGTATQALLPLENPVEMGGRGNEARAVQRLAADPKYVRLFADAFGQAPSAQGLALSIAAFETTITTTDVLANRRLAGEKVLTPDAEVGFQIFTASCVKCHTPPYFTDFSFHNNGASHGEGDIGRATVTRLRSDRRKFKTPGLIGVTKTAPYMHDGSRTTLAQVVAHYSSGGVRNGRVDVNTEIVPLGLTESQQAYLLRFLTEAFEPKVMPRLP